MAISRSQMNRQLRAAGGIMNVTPRENFGLGSSLKKFVRKIIPNEISDIAVKAAPFVAPFNPALAAAMGGIGTFDQTGSISAGLKSGAMNYGGGQLARYAGGAGFQGNPFGDGGAFTGGLQGFKGGFSSPIGTETGLGKFFSGRGTEAVQGVGPNEALASEVSYVPSGTEALASEVSYVPSGTEALASELSYVPNNATSALVDATDMTLVGDVKQAASQEFNLFKAAADKVKNFDYREAGGKALELGKKFGKAAFTNKDGSIDKAAVIGAVAFAGSYIEAQALAADAGVELTEEVYDEARKAEKQEEYAGYLTNFFGGKKDGGRIGFSEGSEDFNSQVDMAKKIFQEYYVGRKEGDFKSPEVLSKVSKETGLSLENSKLARSMYENYIMNQNIEQRFKNQKYGEAGVPLLTLDSSGEIIDDGLYKGKKDGGRIGRKLGSPEEGEGGGVMEMLSVDVEANPDEDESIDSLMAGITFSAAEKSFLFRRLAGGGGASRSYTMPQLYKILNNPQGSPQDARALKQITIGLGIGKKDGGRIGFAEGSEDETETEQEKTMMEKFKKFLSNAALGPNYAADNYGKYGRSLTEEEKEVMKAKIQQEIEAMSKKDGGRIGYKGGANRVSELLVLRDEALGKGEDVSIFDAELFQLTGKTFRSIGGIGDIPTGQMRKNNVGVVERDYRDEGGFVPVGIKERADDVPAMLSKNEFVMTADAVRGIGNGSVEEGSKKLYNTMKQAEQKGKVA